MPGLGLGGGARRAASRHAGAQLARIDLLLRLVQLHLGDEAAGHADHRLAARLRRRSVLTTSVCGARVMPTYIRAALFFEPLRRHLVVFGRKGSRPSLTPASTCGHSRPLAACRVDSVTTSCSSPRSARLMITRDGLRHLEHALRSRSRRDAAVVLDLAAAAPRDPVDEVHHVGPARRGELLAVPLSYRCFS